MSPNAVPSLEVWKYHIPTNSSLSTRVKESIHTDTITQIFLFMPDNGKMLSHRLESDGTEKRFDLIILYLIIWLNA